MKIVLLDKKSLGEGIDLSVFERFGTFSIYDMTEPKDIVARIENADVVLINKIRLNAEILGQCKCLKLIVLAATGFDNVDVAFCRQKGIAVCNVKGYSTDCVAQITVASVLSLYSDLRRYASFVEDGDYSVSGVPNKISPIYHEIAGKTWGIIGYGNIGKAVGRVASALGCRVIAYKKHPEEGSPLVDIDTLCKEADIISLHLPLNEETKNILNADRIATLKPSCIVCNTARGGVWDEEAMANAVKNRKIGGLASDVYTTEPMPTDHPFYAVKDYPNVLLTPHMAWGGLETRIRLIDMMAQNIDAFIKGERLNRVD